MILSIICALAENRAIGFQNHLLYHLRADLKRFKTLTSGHSIIMGRNTFASLPMGALPQRRNIVLSRSLSQAPLNTTLATSLEEALTLCQHEDEVFVIGGEQIYNEALPLAQRLYLTHIHATPQQADAFFPLFDLNNWQCIWQETILADQQNDVDFTFANYQKIG